MSDEYITKTQAYMAIASVFKGGWIQFDSRKIDAAIEDVPPCDVRKNVHAKWIYIHPKKSGDPAEWECSHCKGRVDLLGFAFCPTCGADMREEDISNE